MMKETQLITEHKSKKTTHVQLLAVLVSSLSYRVPLL